MNVLGRIRQVRNGVVNTRSLKRLVNLCHEILGAHGESNSVALAQEALDIYQHLPLELQHDFFTVLAEQFDPDPGEVLRLAERYAINRNPQSLLELTRAAEPPRQELFRRLNRAPGGAAALVTLRATLLKRLSHAPQLKSVDADLEHLLTSWFNPGFLQLRRIDWNSPAMLLEQVIAHEAVHEIVDWKDLRRRLQPDRRCFGFFHPTLPDQALIFVEVALLPEMPATVGHLLDTNAPATDPASFKVATFYSISNCQPGLRGVSLGNFLIKQVALALKQELPQLKTFCTLSPIPSFAQWLTNAPNLVSERIKPKQFDEFLSQLTHYRERSQHWPPSWDKSSKAERELLEKACGFYLLHTSAHDRHPSDPVARFHLGNGARLERVNPQGDLSRKGVKQSLSFMVNYLYDLKDIETNHEQFMQNKVSASRAIKAYF